MENVNKIKNVVDFYTDFNKQLYNNTGYYGVTGHIYGNIILATAFKSEKLYDYNYIWSSVLYRDILFNYYEKAYIGQDDSYFMDKMKSLEVVLSRLIKTRNDINENDFLDQGRNITSLFCGESGEVIFNFYSIASNLRDIIVKDFEEKNFEYFVNCKLNMESKRETMADHTVGALALALALNKEFSYKCNIDKVMVMIVLSNISNALLGNLTYNGKEKELQDKIRYEARKYLFNGLEQSGYFLDILEEYDQGKSKEAKLTHLINEMTIDLQSKIYQDKRIIFDIKSDNPNNETRFDKRYETRKYIYNNKDFPEFKDILKYIKLNNLYIPNIITKEKKLSEHDINTLSSNIYKQLKGYYVDDTIECIYMYNESDEKYKNEKIKIVIVKRNKKNEYIDTSKYAPHIKRVLESNRIVNEKKQCNIEVEFIPSFIQYYTINKSIDLDYLAPLINANVLLDRTGEIRKLQKYIKEVYRQYNEKYPYDDFDQEHRYTIFEPPLDEQVKRRLEN